MAAAVRQLQVLGKDPSRTWFRTIRHRGSANRSRRGSDLHGFDPSALAAENAAGDALYFVVGEASQASGPTGAVSDKDITAVPCLFIEWDSGTLADQQVAWQRLGLPRPTLMLITGGKSVHCYWRLREPLTGAAWRAATARLIAHCQSDPACSNPSRVMRLAGGAYIDKHTGKHTGTHAEIVHEAPEALYDPAEVLRCLPTPEPVPAAPQAAAGAQRPAATTGKGPGRSMAEVEAALACIPRRQPGNGDYGKPLGDRDVLWGLVAAVQEAGGTIETAISLMEAHSPSDVCEWDVRQVAESGDGRIGAGTFWKVAEQHGYNLRRRPVATPPLDGEPFIPPDAPDNAPPPAAAWRPQQQPQGRRGKVALTLTRRMACFERCVFIQATTERNTFRRRVRLLKAAKDLGLERQVKPADLGPMALKAKDAAAGRTFRPLSADDRLAMVQPVVRWLLPELLPAGDLTILGGRPKVGKTRLAMAIAAAVLTGVPMLDLPAPAVGDVPVILVSDDQSDADTASMLRQQNLWDHPRLYWSSHFRLGTEGDLDALLTTLELHPGALVVIDSLRSVGRSLAAGENDPEVAVVLYDLKDAVVAAGGTLLLIHHCNKQGEAVGTESLSGHSAIAGAANTVLTASYLTDASGKLLKSQEDRRLFSEGRSGRGFDLVIGPSGNGYRRVMGHDEWQQQAREAAQEQRQEDRQVRQQERISNTAKRARAALDARGDWMTVREVCAALEVPWGDRGRSTEVRGVRDALHRLVEVALADKGEQGREVTFRSLSRAKDTTENTRTRGTTSQGKGSGLVPNTGTNTRTRGTTSQGKGSGHRDNTRDDLPGVAPPYLPGGADSPDPLRRSVVPVVPPLSRCMEQGQIPSSAALLRLSGLSGCPDDPRKQTGQASLPVVITGAIGSAGPDLVEDDDPAWGPRPAA